MLLLCVAVVIVVVVVFVVVIFVVVVIVFYRSCCFCCCCCWCCGCGVGSCFLSVGKIGDHLNHNNVRIIINNRGHFPNIYIFALRPVGLKAEKNVSLYENSIINAIFF